MPTTTSGLPYAAPGDTADVPYWNQQLAEALQGELERIDAAAAGAQAEIFAGTPGGANLGGAGSVFGITNSVTVPARSYPRLLVIAFGGLVTAQPAGESTDITLRRSGTDFQSSRVFGMGSGTGAAVLRESANVAAGWQVVAAKVSGGGATAITADGRFTYLRIGVFRAAA